jgi:predicted nucleic acid-binding protein
MNSDFPIVIDANVLMQAAVRDTLLRLAERRMFLCRWSEDIIAEVRRNLVRDSYLGFSKSLMR